MNITVATGIFLYYSKSRINNMKKDVKRGSLIMAMSDIQILMEFLQMPLESADAVFDKFAQIHSAICRGQGLEKFLFVEGTRKNKVLLVAHADTYWDDHYFSYHKNKVSIVYEDGIIRNRNGGLGADDRAGCAMIWLLKEMGHSILITNGEEHGRIGSNWLMTANHDIANEINFNHQFIIQLDRRNGRDFKCYSVGTHEFRAYISKITGYSEPDRHYYTDIVTLCRDICGVNLSIGYRNEHSQDEYLVVADWLNTLNLCRQWLSESELPRFCLSADNV